MSDLQAWYWDNWTWLVPTVIGLVATVLVGWWGIKASRQPKQLDYVVVERVQAINAHVDALRRGRPKVYLDDILITDPHFVTLQVINTGKRGVRREDMASPVTIDYAYNAVVLGGVTNWSEGMDSETFSVDWQSPQKVYVHGPELLNPGESYTLQLTCAGDIGEVSAHCRFVDQSRPMREIDVTSITEAYIEAVLPTLSNTIVNALVAGFFPVGPLVASAVRGSTRARRR